MEVFERVAEANARLLKVDRRAARGSRDELVAGALLLTFDVGRILGEGAFAKVHHAKRGSSSYALKLVSRQHPDAATVAALERDVLRAIGAHKHIVSLVEYAETADAYALLLELAEGGEVFDRICEGPYSEADAATLAQAVLEERQRSPVQQEQ